MAGNVWGLRVGTVLILTTAGCTTNDRATPAAGATKQRDCASPASMDAVAAAPGNDRVLLENDRVRVRVLEVTVAAGEREPVHAHCWPAVSYVTSDVKYRDYDGQGKLREEGKETPDESKYPMTSWEEPTPPHSFENLDTKPFRAVLIEIKQ